jgi:hypothetical protein
MDDHFPLITTLNLQEELPSHIPSTHKSVWAAHHMAQIHNTIIRALSSAYNNALSVSPSTQRATDFLFFNATIADTLHHHHATEDDYLFPALEELLGEEGALHENTEQHEAFMDGLMVYTKYVKNTSADEYNGLTLRLIIENFALKLIEHLHDEIPSLLKCHAIKDEEALMGIWTKAAELALKDTDIFVAGPFLLGCLDKDFTVDNLPADFPGFPPELESQVANEMSKKHQGAWEFCPSDFKGNRRALTLT